MTGLGHFLTIDADECRRLLRDATVGRVCWASPEGLQVLPVNYGVDGDLLVFACAEGSLLAGLADPTDVVVQVDDLDPVTATGWSVLVRGRSRTVDAARPGVVPRAWAPGDRAVLVGVEPHHLTGRSVSRD